MGKIKTKRKKLHQKAAKATASSGKESKKVDNSQAVQMVCIIYVTSGVMFWFFSYQILSCMQDREMACPSFLLAVWHVIYVLSVSSLQFLQSQFPKTFIPFITNILKPCIQNNKVFVLDYIMIN